MPSPTFFNTSPELEYENCNNDSEQEIYKTILNKKHTSNPMIVFFYQRNSRDPESMDFYCIHPQTQKIIYRVVWTKIKNGISDEAVITDAMRMLGVDIPPPPVPFHFGTFIQWCRTYFWPMAAEISKQDIDYEKKQRAKTAEKASPDRNAQSPEEDMGERQNAASFGSAL